jgi:type IV pilus assembly protein PilB
MTDRELLDGLVVRGAILAEIIPLILRDSSAAGKTAEDLLYERRMVEEKIVAEVKSTLLKVPYKAINSDQISEEILKFIPRETALSYRLAPLEKKDKLLIVGMLHPDDLRAQEALRFIAKQNNLSLGVYLVTPSDLSAIWRKYGGFQSDIAAAVKEMTAAGEREKVVELEEGGSQADAPIIKIVATTLRQAVEARASDVHIEPQRHSLRIRFRVDGALKQVASLPSSITMPVISRVKVLSNLKLDENRVPQDGRFRTLVNGREIDYRVATFPTPNGEKVAIRVLDPQTGLKGLEGLGLLPNHVEILDRVINRPYGMVLISGPTGSGKSTTLYSLLQRLNKESSNVMSLEDPVEYFMEGVNQSQVRPEIGYSFATGLRQILRQDPDVIMVGEIRDGETAGLAINAALTGHIVLSTIHTNNSLSVVPRMLDLGVPAFLLPSAVSAMIAQRLVLRLCPECKEEIQVSAEANKEIDSVLSSLSPELLPSKPYRLWKAGNKPDCKTCKGKGTSGRQAIMEIFLMSPELGNIISKGFSETALKEEAKKQKMVTLREDGVLKALHGDISLEEVLRETL